MNICDGIKVYNGGRGGNVAELTHGGECFQKRNRKVMCEDRGRRCKDALAEYISSFYPSGVPTWAQEAITAATDLTCDEFPFASSLEGGNPARGVTRCVPADDNNWQGGVMSSFFNPRNRKFIRPGEKYWVEVVGWNCDKQAAARRSDGVDGYLMGRDAFTTAEGVNRTGRMLNFLTPKILANGHYSRTIPELQPVRKQCQPNAHASRGSNSRLVSRYNHLVAFLQN
jgi:hypothetical protein